MTRNLFGILRIPIGPRVQYLVALPWMIVRYSHIYLKLCQTKCRSLVCLYILMKVP